MKNKSFTLIELLVVIAIIGLLASIVLVSLKGAIERAMDMRIVAELKQMEKLLMVFYETHGRYPRPVQGWGVWSGHCPHHGNRDDYILELVPTFTSKLPIDPKFDEGFQCYLYNSDGHNFMMMTHITMETVGPDPSTSANPDIRAMDRVCCWQPTIAIYSPGAKSW